MGFSGQPKTLNSKPQTLNPKPRTFGLKGKAKGGGGSEAAAKPAEIKNEAGFRAQGGRFTDLGSRVLGFWSYPAGILRVGGGWLLKNPKPQTINPKS